ncbi:hypothetical protein CORC01_09073 [Colletotrichum orchidophilum]|uniref:Uncharacterized protein n=1 Tax=Colletotrichum orchidophilum TaxID=1209926 RepID=A0A1G4B2M4_9PEZI|nr:uncharacterized protein CORC01_09073 [Colletotrichum orchidophilum]OHE95641.1 hypothetical protein CORC01_09073 [Colletotrichum orchidophilum]
MWSPTDSMFRIIPRETLSNDSGSNTNYVRTEVQTMRRDQEVIMSSYEVIAGGTRIRILPITYKTLSASRFFRRMLR